LNLRPADYESAALPTELPRHRNECNIAVKKLSNKGLESACEINTLLQKLAAERVHHPGDAHPNQDE
jgi:hypothetical protein